MTHAIAGTLAGRCHIEINSSALDGTACITSLRNAIAFDIDPASEPYHPGIHSNASYPGTLAVGTKSTAGIRCGAHAHCPSDIQFVLHTNLVGCSAGSRGNLHRLRTVFGDLYLYLLLLVKGGFISGTTL